MSRTHTEFTDALSAYARSITVREPEALRKLREESADHPHASMQTAPEQGQLLHLLARATGARKTLEVGTFMGYSSTWVALALPPGGKVIACDVSEEYTSRARLTWADAGVTDRVELRLGPAIETLDAMLAAGDAGTFDFAFIDADKANYPHYYDRALTLLRTGGLIAVDNVLWDGKVIDPAEKDGETQAIRDFNRKLQGDSRVVLSLIPLGDGLTLACKL
ncbi:MAG TPA: class I SAM-dependent methyltransferase [Candidatus Sulfopaludibacter sp.]|nr:class I SAM-dependent methyltransferase [Candidatus Sulfopaludibacter sp.]